MVRLNIEPIKCRNDWCHTRVRSPRDGVAVVNVTMRGSIFSCIEAALDMINTREISLAIQLVRQEYTVCDINIENYFCCKLELTTPRSWTLIFWDRCFALKDLSYQKVQEIKSITSCSRPGGNMVSSWHSWTMAYSVWSSAVWIYVFSIFLLTLCVKLMLSAGYVIFRTWMEGTASILWTNICLIFVKINS